jgi:hypothetical protein
MITTAPDARMTAAKYYSIVTIEIEAEIIRSCIFYSYINYIKSSMGRGWKSNGKSIYAYFFG